MQDTNPIFRDLLLLGDELGSHVPFTIELLQGILSIASHDWKQPDQIPQDTDLS
jgi:hypothetical protein